MEYNTSELCDTYSDLIDVVEPMFSSFGGRNSFGGTISTIKCFEANGLIRELIKENGVGRVLLIDGGGSLRRALLDAEMAATAQENGWEGIVCYGSVREVDALGMVSSVPPTSMATGGVSDFSMRASAWVPTVCTPWTCMGGTSMGFSVR